MKRYKNIAVCLLIAAFSFTGFRAGSRPSAEGKIEWLTIEQAYAKVQKEPKKVLVDLYTDWCGWCKVMDRETFRNKAVVDYVNQNFYAVKLNAEQKEPIVLGNKKFEYLAQGGRGIHEIALAFTNNQPSFPTTIFLDDQFNMIQPLAGYFKPKQFHEVVTFIGGGHYKKEPFEDYQTKTYKKLYQAK